MVIQLADYSKSASRAKHRPLCDKEPLGFKLLLQALVVRGTGHSFLSDNRGHEVIRRDVKSVIADQRIVRGELDVLHVRDLAWPTFLDGNVVAGRAVEVDG